MVVFVILFSWVPMTSPAAVLFMATLMLLLMVMVLISMLMISTLVLSPFKRPYFPILVSSFYLVSGRPLLSIKRVFISC